MIFLLAMEPLHKLFQKTQHMGQLQRLSKGCDRFRASLYADDAALFIKPIASEVLVTENILEIFAQASGLVTNLNKTEFFPTRYEGVSLDFLAQHNINVASFPCIYLGLPLHFRKPT
jgi:hypothetical protein